MRIPNNDPGWNDGTGRQSGDVAAGRNLAESPREASGDTLIGAFLGE
ncbi:hypothetical protein N9089_05185 [Crocinitomicaceae bacterium]|nr:hypothetical protein [Crocinitomicaceae bacterium]